MSDTSPLNSVLQLALLAAPFLLLIAGLLAFWRMRGSRPVLALAALALPLLIFVGVAGATFYAHQARTSFLTDLIVVPDQIAPGRVLTVTMYGEGSVAAHHLRRVGVATDVITATEDGAHWRHDGSDPILDFSAATLHEAGDWGDIGTVFSGSVADADYIYVTGHLSGFIALDPDRWGALDNLGYELGLVSLMYDTSDGLPINLVTSEPIFRFASTESSYFRLPNWSTAWAFEEIFDWDAFTPTPPVGETRFDMLAESVVE